MAGRNRPPAPKSVNKITVGPSSQGSARFPLSELPTGKGLLLTTSDQNVHKKREMSTTVESLALPYVKCIG